MSTQALQTSDAIIDAMGGAENITSLTHCATRLRFELVDADKVDKDALEAVDQVLGAVPQSGDRYQVIVGGAVQSIYNQLMENPKLKKDKPLSDAEVKAQARSKARGKFSWLDNFFEFLSDSFRPILGVLLGASLIIAFAAACDALGLVDFRADDKSASWVFIDAMWRSVFYFLPIMIAYNAAKKLQVDPWVGATVMGALMTPEFLSLSDPDRFPSINCIENEALGTTTCAGHVFGLPLTLNDYGGNVFVPLLMVGILALVYRGLKKIFPANIQMVFVPFISMAVMIPLTAFLVGPLGVWLGDGLGVGLAWLNNHAPFIFAILIPMLYPFLVPLGLHWPLNALMLLNIQTLGYDFIQGPMGTWNFACFGATAGVLFLSMKDKDLEMRQTATGALVAGLFGGISEPSLYGIHLRFKRIYPRMLVGCFAGGLTIAILSAPFQGVRTGAFAFTSLLTIPVFDPMWVYMIAIAVAFITAMTLIVFTGYKDEDKASVKAGAKASHDDSEHDDQAHSDPVPAAVTSDTGQADDEGRGSSEEIEIMAPIAGEVVPVTDVADPVFASKALGQGVGIVSDGQQIHSPISGTIASVAKTGHAIGIKSDSGVEILIHVGIDTVKMEGEGFKVHVKRGQSVNVGDTLADVDFEQIEAGGFDTVTIMTVTNTANLSQVTPHAGATAKLGDKVITVLR